MIDTIKVVLEDYDVRSPLFRINEGWRDTFNNAQHGSGMLYYDGQEWVNGSVAVASDKNFHFEIRPKLQGKAESREPVASINWEISRPFHGHNYYPPTEVEVHESMSLAHEFLKDHGVHTNLMRGELGRVDLAKNISLSQPWTQFVDVAQALTGKRMKATDYPHGRLWKNGNRQVAAYDKRLLMVQQHHCVDTIPFDVSRWEQRTNNRRSIEKALGFSQVGDLLSNLDVLPNHYRQTMGDLVFKHKKGDVEILLANDIEADMRAFKESGHRYWMREFLMTYGMAMIIERVSMDTLDQIVGRVVDNRKMKSLLMNDLRSRRFEADRLKVRKGKKHTLGDLYEELRSKVLA